MRARTRLVIAATVLLLVFGLVGPVAGDGYDGRNSSDTSSPPAERDGGSNATDVEIDAAVAGSDGETTVIVQLEDRPDTTVAGTGGEEPVDTLQAHAGDTQTPFERFAAGTPHVEIERQFWIANALVVTVDTDRVDLERLGTVDHVTGIHENSDVTIASATHSTGAGATAAGAATANASTQAGIGTAQSDTTDGLERINATDVWDEFETRGEGVKVAVLDTGYDLDYETDIGLYTRDSTDPTYPGGWAEFDDDGSRVSDSEPHDTGYHGTHVSGTVAGGDASGQHIGVAPDADLAHGQVLSADGGTSAQSIAGIEWAVESDADVVSMSLGTDCSTASSYIEAVRNAQDAGTTVVAASGNDGDGCTGSPGNIYDTIGVGATDDVDDVAAFSGSESFDTSAEWGSAAPSEWPDNYTTPAVVAPGVGVLSAYPDDGEDVAYARLDGTSMATPHVAGAIALLQASTEEDLEPAELRTLLTETAVDVDEDDARQGAGRIDVFDARLEYERQKLEPTITPDRVNVSEDETIAVAVDPTYEIEEYRWSVDGEPIGTTTEPEITHTFDEIADDQQVTVEFVDAGTNYRTETAEIDVVDERPPTPALEATQTDGIEVGTDTVEFDASASTDTHAIDRYEWDVDGDRLETTGPVVERQFDDPGERTVSVTVVDEAGNENETSVDVTAVDTTPPTPALEVPAEPIVGGGTFDATDTTDNHGIDAYEWTVGGEPIENASEPVLEHAFETDGTRAVNLTVRDPSGNENTSNESVAVRLPPSVTIDEPAADATVGDSNVSVSYTLADTDVADAAGLEYRVVDADDESVVDWTAGPFEAARDAHQFDVPTGDLSDGEYAIALRVIDDDGDPLPFETASDEQTIAVKSSPPAVDLEVRPDDDRYPAIGAANPAVIDVAATGPRLESTTVTVTEDGGDDPSHEWELAATETDENGTTLEWPATSDNESVESGQYTVAATAADDLENENTSETTIDVDGDAPTVSIADVDGIDGTDGVVLDESTTLTVTGSVDDVPDPERGTTLSATAESMATTYRYDAPVDYDAETGTWTATMNGSALPDDGEYEVAVTATDAAKNEHAAVTEPVTVDRSPPRLSAVATDVNDSSATVRVRATEPLRDEPTVDVETPTGTDTVSDLAADSERTWTGTVDVDEAGTYELTARGVDPAGNEGTDVTTTTVRSGQTTDDRPLTTVSNRTGAFVTVNTTAAIDDARLALSETETAPAALESGTIGLEFLTASLDDDLDAARSNATIGIPVEAARLPENVTADDDRVALRHYDEERQRWADRPATVREFDGNGELEDGNEGGDAEPIDGDYWVTTVENASSAGLMIDDRDPPELVNSTPAAGATLENDTDEVAIELEYGDDLSGVDPASIDLFVDGENATDSERTRITSNRTVYEGLPVEANESPVIELDLADRAGNAARLETTFDVAADDEGEPESGGSGGGLSLSPPSDEEELERPEPSAAIDVDSDPALVGEEIRFSGAESTDDEREIIRYEWVVDGTDRNGATVATAFDEPGTYDIELTVTNDFGESDTETASVVVDDSDDESPENETNGSAVDANESAARADPPGGDRERDGDDDSVPGFGPITALAAVLAVAARLRRTR